MARRQRQLSPFSLSFLDIMSCGFGAVVLLFLIIKHQTDVAAVLPDYDLNQEVATLEKEIAAAERDIVTLAAQSEQNTLDLKSARSAVSAEQDALSALQRRRLPDSRGAAQEIADLRARVSEMRTDKRALETQLNARSRAIRTFTGEGNREYLTGLQLGGERILILLDVSASMLDESIVNVVRRRNMDDDAKRRSQKWQQALATVDWISARFPPNSRYQIYLFSDRARPALANSAGRWLSAGKVAQLDDVIAALRRSVPAGGSNLESAFLVMSELSPPPDNVFLITDGLPTRGQQTPNSSAVSGSERLQLFETAVTRIPRGIPVNTVLLPMEGDPMAPSAYWQIALFTRGAFLSPASDWP